MPQTMHRQRWLTTLLALAVTFGAFMFTAEEAEGAPPVDDISWSGEGCLGDLPAATVTASGRGRWAILVIEVSIDGGPFESLGSLFDPLRIEHEDSLRVAWTEAGETAVFRASDAKSNGTLMGDWVDSDPIDCA